MGLLDRFRKRDEEPEIKVDPGLEISKLSRKYEVVEDYRVHKPMARIKIVKSPSLGEGLHYFVDEVSLSDEEYKSFKKIMKILSKEMDAPTNMDLSPEDYIFDQAGRVAEKYYRALGQFTQAGWNKLFYYVVRDLAGYGPLHAIMLDPNIEDVSYNGLNTPIYIWHRIYESIPTNIRFVDEQTANDFLIKLAHRCSKHISSASPLMDGMLPEKHRLAATFMNEVSMKGSTFCIRKFRAEPFSIVDMIKVGTLDERIAAYFWLILEYKMSFMIVGGTGAGKTSMLNALLSLMSGNDKIVTVEEVPELSPPLANWTQLNSRESFQFGQGASNSINIFDLVKVSLRYRPDYIIVGEVRGEEAYTLFQALATGHGGLCTMHADSITNVVKRLTSPPMNVAKVYIPLMNSALHVQRIELPQEKHGLSFGRRVRTIWEIEDYDNYREVAVWNPRTDTFDTWFEDSVLLERISESSGKSKHQLLMELDKRTEFLQEIVASEIRAQAEVAEKILSYYNKEREGKDSKKPKKKGKSKKGVKKTPPTVSEDLEKEVDVPTTKADVDSDLDLTELPDLQDALPSEDPDEAVPLEEAEKKRDAEAPSSTPDDESELDLTELPGLQETLNGTDSDENVSLNEVEPNEEVAAPPVSADVDSDLDLTDLLVEMKDYLEKTDGKETPSDVDGDESTPLEEVAETGG
jgi:flagellar protein FlaI